MSIAVSYIKVFVCAVTVEKRSAYAHLHDVLAKALEKIDGACHSCIFAESDKPVSVFVSDFFIVNQANIALQDCVQSRHVVKLPLGNANSTLITCGK